MEDILIDIRPDEDSSSIYEDTFHLDYMSGICDEQIFGICPSTNFNLDFFSSKCLGNCFDCHDSQDPFMLTDTNPMWSQIFVIQSPQNISGHEKPLQQQSLLKARNKNGHPKFHLVTQPNVQKPLPMCQALVNPQDICPIIIESKRRNCLLQNIHSNGKTVACVGKENKKVFKSCSSNSDYGSETSDDYQLDLKFFEDDLKVSDEMIELWPSESSGSDEEKLIDIENLEFNSQNFSKKSPKCKLKSNKRTKSEPITLLETQFGQINNYNIKIEPSCELDYSFEDIKQNIKSEVLSPEFFINEMHNYSTGPLKVVKYMSHSAPHSPQHIMAKSTKNKSRSNTSSPNLHTKKIKKKKAFKIPKNLRHNYQNSIRNGISRFVDIGDERSRRAQHNVLERKRRSNLKDLFLGLQEIVPEMKGNHRFSKVSILNEARAHINNTQQDVEILQKKLKKLEEKQKSLKNLLRKITDN